MEYQELIKKRHSVRKFINKPIEDAKINNILEAGRICQSAMNRQPWYIKIVKDKEKNDIVNILNSVNEPALSRNAESINQCDTLLLVYTDKDNENNVSDMISIGAMIEHMCLAAFNENLGCLWCRYIAKMQDEISKYLNINDKYLVSSILLGYYDCDLIDKPRKSLDEILIK